MAERLESLVKFMYGTARKNPDLMLWETIGEFKRTIRLLPHKCSVVVTLTGEELMTTPLVADRPG